MTPGSTQPPADSDRFTAASANDAKPPNTATPEAAPPNTEPPNTAPTDASGPAAPIRLAAVDDHPITLRGLQAAFSEMPGITLKTVFRHTRDLLASNPAAIDVVLLDLELRDGTSAPANVAAIAEAGPAVVIYTNEHKPAVVGQALRAGALGLVLKGDPERHIQEAVVAAARGEHYESTRLAVQLTSDPAGQLNFSPRELEVLERLALGLSWSALAADLDISVSTARTHLQRVMETYLAAGIPVAGGPREVVARSLQAGHINPFDRG